MMKNKWFDIWYERLGSIWIWMLAIAYISIPMIALLFSMFFFSGFAN